MNYNGQSKAEYEKNYVRINNIIRDAEGDKVKELSLAKKQASLITKEWKALNRAMAAKELGYEHLFEVFFFRAYKLGSVPHQEYRDYVLNKLID